MTHRDPLLIGLCGHAGAGKDAAAHRLVSLHGFERYALADPIRSMLGTLFSDLGIDCASIFERHLKESEIPELGVSPRHLMQTLGTEWGRHLRDDFWLRAAELTLGLHPGGTPIHDRLVISDVRFPNEAAWIESKGGFVVRVLRSSAEPVARHESEQHIEAIVPWARIDNNGTLRDLHDQVYEMVHRLEALP